MKRKWRKKRMMTPRRQAKRIDLLPVLYWETVFYPMVRALKDILRKNAAKQSRGTFF